MHNLTKAIIACDKLKPNELQIIKELIEETQNPNIFKTIIEEMTNVENMPKMHTKPKTTRTPMQMARNRQKNTHNPTPNRTKTLKTKSNVF